MSASSHAGASSSDGAQTARSITRELARYAAHACFSELPEKVRTEAARAFLNWVGCALGGCREPAVKLAAETVADLGGAPQASIIGSRQRTDLASAAFVNCMSSSILGFDDAHLRTVTHPSGPVTSALFALSEKKPVAGTDFLAAVALGIEITCRLSNVLLLPPSRFNLGFYVTGLSGPIGVAIAVGRLLNLDEQRMAWAIGLAASQASGFRSTHGTMTAHFRPGHAARCGVWAAMLAARGFDCTDDALEAGQGFVDVFSSNSNLSLAVDGLGRDFELLTNGYKPYPCGIVIHPTIDACLEIWRQLDSDAKLRSVSLTIHPSTLALTGVRTPTTPLDAQISVFHWAATALLRGTAGVPEMQKECFGDPAIAALRDRVTAMPDATLGPGEAIAEVTTAGGRIYRSHIVQARGSENRPLTDDELDAKFRGQAIRLLPPDKVNELLRVCRSVSFSSDVGGNIARVWEGCF